MDDRLTRKIQLDRLYDIYGPLLTEKQRQIFMLHHERDWSLAEIAETIGMTRQGVHDLFQRARDRLKELEELLGCLERESRLTEALENLSRICIEQGLSLPTDITEDLRGLIEAEETEGTGRLHV
ncbi:MAG: sigma factor-like helix-turn-helix DNA-binding protein [Thermovirgaceae bacterium]